VQVLYGLLHKSTNRNQDDDSKHELAHATSSLPISRYTHYRKQLLRHSRLIVNFLSIINLIKERLQILAGYPIESFSK
jgi:hypothetical protein